MKIYIYREEGEYGPYTFEQIHAFKEKGFVIDQDWARTDDSEDWEVLERLLEMKRLELFPVEKILEQVEKIGERKQIVIPTTVAVKQPAEKPVEADRKFLFWWLGSTAAAAIVLFALILGVQMLGERLGSTRGNPDNQPTTQPNSNSVAVTPVNVSDTAQKSPVVSVTSTTSPVIDDSKAVKNSPSSLPQEPVFTDSITGSKLAVNNQTSAEQLMEVPPDNETAIIEIVEPDQESVSMDENGMEENIDFIASDESSDMPAENDAPDFFGSPLVLEQQNRQSQNPVRSPIQTDEVASESVLPKPMEIPPSLPWVQTYKRQPKAPAPSWQQKQGSQVNNAKPEPPKKSSMVEQTIAKRGKDVKQPLLPPKEQVVTEEPGVAENTNSLYRRIKLKRPKGVDKADLWVMESLVESPENIFLICLDASDSALDEIQKAEWQNFAKENKCLLATLNLGSSAERRKTHKGYHISSKGSGEMLLAGLDKLDGGQKLPLIIYGRRGGGSFAASFAHYAPKRVKAWAGFSGAWDDQEVGKHTDAPPGIIGSNYEGIEWANATREFFEKGRVLRRRLTWISAPNIPNRAVLMEEFTRNYFKAVINGVTKENEVWMETKSKEQSSSVDKMVNPVNYAWLPHPSLKETWIMLMPSRLQQEEPVILEKTVSTRCAEQPEIKFFIRLPQSASKGVKPNGVLAFCTWEKDPAALRKGMSYQVDEKGSPTGTPPGLSEYMVQFAERKNLAIMTWNTAQVWSVTASSDELQKKEQRAFDRNFDRLASAWSVGLRELCSQLKIPNDNILLYGFSRGAQWAHRLALRKPEHFLAIHIHIPSTFDVPTKNANKLMWLVTTGEREVGYDRAKRFYTQAHAMGYPMIFKAIVGLGHDSSAAADNLGGQFFRYALKLKEDRELGLEKDRGGIASLKKDIKDWRHDFKDPAFTGDFLNQEMFPREQVDMIPVSLRVPLPTKDIAMAWSQN